MLLLIILIALIVIALLSATVGPSTYRGGSIGVGALLVVVLGVFLLTGVIDIDRTDDGVEVEVNPEEIGENEG